MLHEEVYKQFKKQFPQYSKWTTDWFPNGKDSVRIRMGSSANDFVFTYHSMTDWRFETADSFINGLKKGGRTMNVGLHDNLHESK